MDAFLHQVLAGLATGGIYASLALALVMIYQATHLVNFAQGEMAMFTTYIAWSLINAGMPYWPVFLLTVGIAFILGILIERIVIRPVENAPVLAVVVVFIGLLVILNSVAGWIYTYTIKSFPSPFPRQPILGIHYISAHELGAIGVTLAVLALLYAFFRFTPLGLAMRAAAQNPESSRLVGIRVGWMLALGWGLAASVGAVAGMMVAPVVYLDPNMMSGILLYAFAAALLGGIDSPGGAVLGGFTVGVLENVLGAFVALGAYCAAILIDGAGAPYWAVVPAAGGVCLVAGFLFGLPALRLEGLYLALATFALGVAMPQLLKYHHLEKWTGGVQGIVIVKPEPPAFLGEAGLRMNSDQWLYFFALAVAALMFVLGWNLLRGRVGRALIAIRDQHIAAEAMGINSALYKSLAFGVSAMYTGIAGALGAIAVQYVAPDSFTIFLSLVFLVGIVVGGLASISGALYGALFIQFVPNVADEISKAAPWAIFGLFLIGFVYLMPSGVAGAVRMLLVRLMRKGAK